MFEFFKPLQLERFLPFAEQLARGDGGALPDAAVHRAGGAVDDDGSIGRCELETVTLVEGSVAKDGDRSLR